MGERQPTVLYDLDLIKITDWPEEEDGHFLYIGAGSERGYALMRGVLQDLGRRDTFTSLISSLDQINPGIVADMESNNIPSDILRLAFNQARIRELENQVSFMSRRSIDLEEEVEALQAELDQDS